MMIQLKGREARMQETIYDLTGDCEYYKNKAKKLRKKVKLLKDELKEHK
ncbi:unnamed protein product [marine sediment metagenome]|uniref:Uncharacterized protein n=1 Tax=marine sediment metagenome TaxID=412755 RepID=X0XEY4_9ZZZZ